MGSDRALDELVAEFAAVRPRLFGIAYRMLGSVADAEDIVQDAWLRWQGQDRAEVRDATAFLVTVTTRLAINATQAARTRRESYVGPWLPEPVDTSADSEVASYTDGGGAVRNASRIPVVGRTRVARYLRAFAGRFWAGVAVDWVEANGGPAALLSRDGRPAALLTVHGTDQRVDRIYWVMNPAKLEHIAAVPRMR